MKASGLKTLLLFLLVGLVARGAQAQYVCDEVQQLVGALTTDNIKRVEATFPQNEAMPPVGKRGELHLRFETPLGKNGKMTGWLQIALVEVVSIKGNSIQFKVVEEKSTITIDGNKANHFKRDNIVKFTYQLYGNDVQEHIIRSKDGKLLEKGELICGKLQGELLAYHPDGTTIKDRSQYVKGKRQGNAVAYHPNGLPSTTAQYVNDTIHGTVEKFTEKGILRSRFEFKNGKPDGAYAMFYPDGTVEEKGSRKGDNFSNIQLFRADGTLLMEVERSDAGVKKGKVRTYRADGKTLLKEERYDNGSLREEANYNEMAKIETRYLYDTAQLVLSYEVYHPNGTIALRRARADSTKGGAYTRFYPNGEKQEEGFLCLATASTDSTLASEQSCGERRTYHENGQLKEITNFKNGKQEGEYRSFYPNGKPHIVSQKANDGYTGAYTETDENGELIATGTYSTDGKRTGKWRERNAKGKVKKVTYP